MRKRKERSDFSQIACKQKYNLAYHIQNKVFLMKISKEVYVLVNLLLLKYNPKSHVLIVTLERIIPPL